MKRTQISTDAVLEAVKDLTNKLNYRLNQKGYGTFSSRHEILGVIQEEHNELIEAVTNLDLSEIKQELLDIAVGAIFAIACINEETLDW